MTAISALISKDWISVASDSMLTVISENSVKHIEFKQSKIVPIQKFRASAAYWGLAKVGNWQTYNFLKRMASEAERFPSFESFANHVYDELNAKLASINVTNPTDKGIGIHLAGFEEFEGEKLPELFLITNYSNTSYRVLKPLEISRNLYETMKDEFKNGENTLDEKRRKVREHLSNGHVFVFNNGDPELFNPSANAITEIFIKAKNRNVLKDEHYNAYLKLASNPIKIIKMAQQDLFKKEYIRVGGQIHDLLITKEGTMISNTGDNRI